MSPPPPPPLRLLLFDATCRGRGRLPGLSLVWMLGARLYRTLGWIDRFHGARSWEEALSWLAAVEPGRPVAEIQFWGHGRWGLVRIGREALDRRALLPGHPLRPRLVAVRSRLAGPESRWWFRTCETFGGRRGHEFAKAWTGFFRCRAAGHTFVVAFWQSGLHVLEPGQEPTWPAEEGLAEGTADAPVSALKSGPCRPNTVTCLTRS